MFKSVLLTRLFCVQTLKGVGGDVIICEEAAALDMQVFYGKCYSLFLSYSKSHFCLVCCALNTAKVIHGTIRIKRVPHSIAIAK